MQYLAHFGSSGVAAGWLDGCSWLAEGLDGCWQAGWEAQDPGNTPTGG